MPTPRQTFGSAQTVINTTTNLTAGTFTGAPTTFDNTSDASVPYAPFAAATLVMPTFAAAPAVGTVIELWGVLQNVDGTSDDSDAPASSNFNGARYFGSFAVDGVTSLQRRTINVDMRGITAVDFYLKNGTAQQMTNNGGTACTLKVTPFTIG